MQQADICLDRRSFTDAEPTPEERLPFVERGSALDVPRLMNTGCGAKTSIVFGKQTASGGGTGRVQLQAARDWVICGHRAMTQTTAQEALHSWMLIVETSP
jgi:hypothetical protein